MNSEQNYDDISIQEAEKDEIIKTLGTSIWRKCIFCILFCSYLTKIDKR